MIIDMTDLEPALEQYDSAIILVGPLLSLSINSNLRYLYLAGNGAKVYNPLGLGFIDNVSDAEQKRADIIDKLKARFAEVVTFGDHAEMARAVDGRWPSEEAARVLTSVELAARAQQASFAAITESNAERVLSDAQDEGLVDTPAQELLVPEQTDENPPSEPSGRAAADDFVASEQHLQFRLVPGETATTIEPTVTNVVAQDPTKPGSDDSVQPDDEYSVTSAFAAEPIGNHCDETNAKQMVSFDEKASAPRLTDLLAAIAATSQAERAKVAGRHNPDGRYSDDLLRSTAGANTALPSASAKSEPDDMVVPLAMGAGGLTLTILQFAASAAAIAFMVVFVLPNLWQPIEKPPAATVAASSVSNSDNDDRQSGPARIAPSNNSSSEAQFVTAAPVQSLKPFAHPGPPTQQQLASAYAESSPLAAASAAAPPKTGTAIAPVSASQASVAPAPSANDQPDAAVVAHLVERGMRSLQSGDLQSARLSLQRAAEAIAPPLGSQPTAAGAPSSSRSNDRVAAAAPPLQEVASIDQAASAELTPAPAAAPSPSTNGVNDSSAADASQGAATPAVTKLAAINSSTLQPKTGPAVTLNSRASPAAQELAMEAGTAPVITEQATSAQVSSPPRSLDPDQIASLLKRGIGLLKNGDIASARLCLQRAAEAGNGEAALALGSTYDPLVLKKLGIIGIAPDLVQARQWYQKAKDLGSNAAVEQLAMLAQPGR